MSVAPNLADRPGRRLEQEGGRLAVAESLPARPSPGFLPVSLSSSTSRFNQNKSRHSNFSQAVLPLLVGTIVAVRVKL